MGVSGFQLAGTLNQSAFFFNFHDHDDLHNVRVVIFCKCAGLQGEEECANVKKSSCARKRVLSVVEGEILQQSIALDHLKRYLLETHQSCIY